MDNRLSEQALESRILTETGSRTGKSFVTLAALVVGVLAAAAGQSAVAAAATAGTHPGSPVVAPALPAHGAGDAGGAVAGAMDDMAEAIAGELELRSASIDASVAPFYLARVYRPAWAGAAQVAALLAAVEASREHGLDPADFALERLRQVVDADPATLSPAQRAEREVTLSDSLARLLRQLRYGKLDPRLLYREWNFAPQPGPSLRAGELEAVLAAPGLEAAIADHAPALPLYRLLQQAYAQYRAQAALGDWPPVPAGPTLHPGERDRRVVALRARLQAGGERGLETADPAYFDPLLAEAVRRFQRAHGLEADALVGRQTMAALGVGPARRADQIRANLERLRWVAQDLQGDHLRLDIAAQTAELVLDGQRAWSSRVVVGRPSRKTPLLRDRVQHLVLNPKWVVPPTILKQDVIPAMVRDPGYLAAHRMRVVDGKGQAVDPAAIDWAAAPRDGFPYRIVQESGADGALGRIKFALTNPYTIFMHDTNAPELFGRSVRAFSSGCLRLEKPLELALLLLDDPQRWSAETLVAELDRGATRTIAVGREIPVLLLYFTAGLDETGGVQLRQDIYSYDEEIIAALTERRSAESSDAVRPAPGRTGLEPAG